MTADFSLGTLKSVVADPPDQLRLADISETEPYIWVANYTSGRITKIDTRTGAITGQYYSTAPSSRVLPDNLSGQGQLPSQGSGDNSPSRTAVDLDGNAYVANRGYGWQGSVTKIAGSKAYGVDYDGDGHIDTSTGQGNLLPGDECILWTAKVGTPGMIPRGVAVDAENNVWVGTFSDGKLYKFNGQTGEPMTMIDLRAESGIGGVEIYGIAIGNDGLIYTTSVDSRWACCVDPSAAPVTRVRAVRLGFPGYGLAVDKQGVEWIGRWESGSDGYEVQAVNWRADPPVVSYMRASLSGRTRGVAIDGDGCVWVANNDASALMKFGPTGQFVTSYSVASGPIGVAVDAAGKIWAVGGSTCSRINPADGQRDDFPTGGEAYSYSDMTGFQLRNYTARQGSWSVTCDGGSYRAKWNTISWTAMQPEGTLVNVEVRTAEAVGILEVQPWVQVTSGAQMEGVAGRYIEVRATLRTVWGDASPVLYDITVAEPSPGPTPLALDIPGAKQAAEDSVVALSAKAVTCVENGLFYIQETDHYAGIGVRSYDAVSVGDRVDVKGAVQTINGERMLIDALVLSSTAGTALTPVTMTSRALGGEQFGYQPGVVGGNGPSNVGLFVTISGRVTAQGSDYCYVDDGGGCDDGSGSRGVKVLCAGASAAPVGSYVFISGASSAFIGALGVARQVGMSSKSYIEYCNGFDSAPGSEWSNVATSTTPTGGRKFLGEFSNGSVTLTLTGLGPHSQAAISLDIFVMKSWDGNESAGPDIVDISVLGGPTLLHSTFALWSDSFLQTFPDPYPAGPTHPARTGAVENNTLGYYWDGRPMDSVYHVTYTAPHSGDTLQIIFSGQNLEGVSNESWGLDNVTVQLR